MTIDAISAGKAVSITAEQIIVRRDDNTPISVCWQLDPGTIFVVHADDEEFPAVLRQLGLSGVTVKEVRPGQRTE